MKVRGGLGKVASEQKRTRACLACTGLFTASYCSLGNMPEKSTVRAGLTSED